MSMSRRGALLALPAAVSALALSAVSPAVSFLAPFPATAAAAAPSVDWAAVKKDIISVISDPKATGGIGEKGPTLVRLAWHSSGTYDKMSQTGGSGGGTIRFKEELAHGGNAGLENAVAWLDSVYAKHPGISYADLYTYAGERPPSQAHLKFNLFYAHLCNLYYALYSSHVLACT